MLPTGKVRKQMTLLGCKLLLQSYSPNGKVLLLFESSLQKDLDRQVSDHARC